MDKKDYSIELTDEQLAYVKKVQRSKNTCKTLKVRCQIFMDLDKRHGKQMACAQAAHSNGVAQATVYSAIRNFKSNGLEKALTLGRGEGSNHSMQKVDGRTEAQLIKLACGPVPEGHARWTLRLLEEKGRIVLDEPVGKSTIGRILKKTNFDPTKANIGASPKKKTPTS